MAPALATNCPQYSTQYHLPGPVQAVGPSDSAVFIQLFNLIHGAVSTGLPAELPSNPWAGVRAVDALPFFNMDMTYATLVRFVEANFQRRDLASGQMFQICNVMLRHAVLNPEGSGEEFSHFFPAGLYLNVIPMARLEALAIDDAWCMSKRMRYTDPSGMLRMPVEEAHEFRRRNVEEQRNRVAGAPTNRPPAADLAPPAAAAPAVGAAQQPPAAAASQPVPIVKSAPVAAAAVAVGPAQPPAKAVLRPAGPPVAAAKGVTSKSSTPQATAPAIPEAIAAAQARGARPPPAPPAASGAPPPAFQAALHDRPAADAPEPTMYFGMPPPPLAPGQVGPPHRFFRPVTDHTEDTHRGHEVRRRQGYALPNCCPQRQFSVCQSWWIRPSPSSDVHLCERRHGVDAWHPCRSHL